MKLLSLFFIVLSSNLLAMPIPHSFDWLSPPTYCEAQDNSFIDSLQDITEKMSPYKSEWELELYRRKYGHCIKSSERNLACYKGISELKKRCFAKAELKHTMMQKEKEALKEMSKIFGIPYSFLYCTYFVESRFKPFAESKGVGAKGIAQLMPGRQSTLKAYFTMPSGNEYNNCKKSFNYYKKVGDTASVNLCNIYFKRAEDYKNKWKPVEKYYISKGIIQNSLTPQCNPMGAYCGIAVGVANYFYNIRQIEKNFPKLDMDVNNFEVLQMLMHTYNAGDGVVYASSRVRAIQVCQKNNKLIPGCVAKEVRKKYQSNPKKYGYLTEPIGYATGISNCIKKDNYNPPVKGEVSLSCK